MSRRYEPEIMRQALAQQDDGSYYSIFSNQCQDWADRLRRSAERIEKSRGVRRTGDRGDYQKPVPPTEPASAGMGVVSCLLGVAAVVAPLVAGAWFSLIMGLVFLAMGASHMVYAWHGRDVRSGTPILVFGSLFLLAGAAVLLNREFAMVVGSLLIAGFIGLQGLAKIAVAAFSRPLQNWAATLAEGALLTAFAIVFLHAGPTVGRLGLVSLWGWL